MRVTWAIQNLKNKFKATAIFLGLVLLVGAFWESKLLDVLGQDMSFDLTLFGMWLGTLILGLSTGAYAFDQPPLSQSQISEAVKKAVDENMKDLCEKILEEVKKDRQFQRVKPP